MSLKEKIGKICRERRLELGLSQETLGEYSGLLQKQISKIENGQTNVTIESLEKVLEVLGLELDIKVRDIS